jgi:hypothetical protein
MITAVVFKLFAIRIEVEITKCVGGSEDVIGTKSLVRLLAELPKSLSLISSAL